MILKKKKIRNDIKSFLRLYANRPIKDNSGGVLFGHAFALHYFLKKLKPKLIVESGTFKGQSSWLMRQTCPKSKIVTLDIYPNKLEYKNKKIKYLYKDFTLCDWSKIPKNSLIFLMIIKMHWRELFMQNGLDLNTLFLKIMMKIK